jgi:two-component system CheB/CheR fusion protein
LVRPELQSELRLALHHAFTEQTNVSTRPVPVQFNGAPHPVTILLRPTPTQRRALVLFWETLPPKLSTPQEEASAKQDQRAAHFEAQLLHSEQQLQSSKEEYESTVEELRAANEELQSTNEEYRSTLEELETSKEELQSVNEELLSVNQEMKIRVEEIAAANSDLQNLFAATEIATLFLDRELYVKRYTPRAAELFNLMPSDRGRPIGHLRTKLNYPTLEADIRRVLSDLIPLERELQAEDGRWFLVGVRPYRTVEDKIDGIVVTCVDISANKANEVALREANQQLSRAHELFSSLFHANPIPTVLTRLQNGLVLDANDAYLRFFELPRETVIGSTIHQVGAWLQADERAELAKKVRQEGHVGSFEMTTTHPSGQNRTALVSIERVEQDGTEAAIWAFVDITDLKQAQESLRRSEERLRLTLESVTDYAYITLDTSGRIVDWQAGAELMFGYSRDEILGQPVAILFTPEDRAQGAPEAEIEQARTTGRAADERWHLRKDGTRFFMSGVMVPLHDGKIIGYVKVARDLTERRQMEEALESEVQVRTEQVRTLVIQLAMSEQEERRRISGILHDDLQQQLFSLNVQLAMLHQQLDSQALTDARQTIADIGEALGNSIQVTRSLSVNLSPPILHDEGLFEAIRWLASHIEQQQGLHVEVRLEGTLPLLDEDLRVLLFQVVRELLFNIVKHAGVTTAAVALAVENQQLRIEVSDRGQGFDATLHRAQASQGLLRISQRLELIGGRFEVNSSPGQGTHVIIHVPQSNQHPN